MDSPAGWRWVLCRPATAAVALLAAYVALSFLVNPQGFLGTDTGGKVATLEVMTRTGTLDPDVGYWAAEFDPDADLHGLYYTAPLGDRYVNVTSLPMIYAAYPLYTVGGYRLALLLPMAGSIAAAFGAREIARRVGGGSGGGSDGWLTFWLMGLASPLAIYALDLWEHSIGVALLVWAVVALVDVVARRATWWRGLVAGLAIGAAFTMRTEAIVYGFVAVAITCGVVVVRRREVARGLVVGASAVIGVAVPVVANNVFERAVLGETFRSGRASSAAGSGLSRLATRFDEAVITTGAIQPSSARGLFVVAVGLVGLLCFVAHRSAGGGDRVPAQIAAAAVAGLYLWRASAGPGFVPGFVAALPFAAVGLVLAWRTTSSRVVGAIAVMALPLVWAFQYTGGALPQWGGRYVLVSAVLLGAVGVARSALLEPWARTFFVVLSVGVTAFGFLWMVERTDGVAEAAREIAGRPEPVVVSDVEFWLRELGAEYPTSRWLTVRDGADLARAAAIVERSGFDSFVLLDLGTGDEGPDVAGFTAVSVEHPDWLDAGFRLVSYRSTGA